MIRCAAKRMNRDLQAQRPTRTADFTTDGEKETRIHVLRLGSFVMVGVQPEISGVTARQIADALPGDNVAVCVMVNGVDKCMPEREAYELAQYPCINSPYMPGGAEKLRDAAVELANQSKEVSL